MRAFSVAARHGSFTKAGEALHVTQGAISRQVKRLEETVGRPLFFRAHQGIELTEAGRTLALALEQAFDQMERAVSLVSEDKTRRQIAINIPPTFATRWMAPRLTAFRKLYPYIDVSITTDLVQQLRDVRQHDCLVVFDQAPWPKVQCERLMLEHHVMCASSELWRHGLPPSLSDATLLHILNGNTRLPVWENWIATHGLTYLDPAPGLSFSTLDQAINAALAGAGVAIVDEVMVKRELDAGSLMRIGTQSVEGPWGYWFIDTARDSERKALVRLFGDWLIDQTHPAALDMP